MHGPSAPPHHRSALLLFHPQSSVIIDQKYQATIAIETDGEYYNLFRNRDRALNYIADMIGCEAHWGCS